MMMGLVYIRETCQTFPTVTHADSAPPKLAELKPCVKWVVGRPPTF